MLLLGPLPAFVIASLVTVIGSDLTQDLTNPYSVLKQGYYISCSIITYDGAA